ncbi:MAG: polysaccharide biosynthesis protein [Gammaproteobacteria bacterium]
MKILLENSHQFSLFNRQESLFSKDIQSSESKLNEILGDSKILIVGAAGSIGQSVSNEIFKRNPKILHLIDLSENNLVELIRTLRSSFVEFGGELKSFALDVGSKEFELFISQSCKYDFVFNLSALKHVRSEKDPFTLMRLINVNIFNSLKLLRLTEHTDLKNYFCVSTDKATNPVNLMGASKKIMENFLIRESENQNISLARFANVAFSDGSLLFGFEQRIKKKQPLSAPLDIERYFITQQESGELCMISGILGKNRDIFFPKLNEKFKLMKFSDIALNYLNGLGFEPEIYDNEFEAKENISSLIKKKKWPCYFFESDTTGEKQIEEFFTNEESIDANSFKEINIIKNKLIYDDDLLNYFEREIKRLVSKNFWLKKDIVEIFQKTLPNFIHNEKNKDLDQKM